ncbi:hypothetical protein [Microbacterium sp. PAMC22086]|uniref:hypothetical protein n=1 Tax=Microbacterium sp. PAMC22086 TaxID=2861281 RepID=UPI001C6339C1|nr:hypothetical protein [Microbacterium sp. PAMC22086]QYG11519.1 hypothetical protein KY497_14885 [Microbacterium sp. PAMC22086]
MTALAGCTTTAAPQAADASPKPAASQAPKPSTAESEAEAGLPSGYVDVGHGTSVPAGSPEGCETPAYIHITGMSAEVTGKVVDQGARDFASGTVGLDDEGTIVSYTVAPGDVPTVVGERLCIYNGIMLATLNHTRDIHPDQVLRLNPDPAVTWVPYYNPNEAGEGFQQIPYQEAIEAMGRAADAGNVDTMRGIWNDTLRAMFTDPAVIDQIQKALDSGDPAVLGQMFS